MAMKSSNSDWSKGDKLWYASNLSSVEQVTLPLELPRNSRFKVEKRQARPRYHDVSLRTHVTLTSPDQESHLYSQFVHPHYSYQDIMRNDGLTQESSATILLGPNTRIPVASHVNTAAAANRAHTPAQDTPEQNTVAELAYRQRDLFEDVDTIKAEIQHGRPANSERWREKRYKKQNYRAVALRNINHILNSAADDDAAPGRSLTSLELDLNKKKLRHKATVSEQARSTLKPAQATTQGNTQSNAQSNTQNNTQNNTQEATLDESRNAKPCQDDFGDVNRLKDLLDSTSALWRGGSLKSEAPGHSSGYAELDAILPTQGWPAKSIIEVLTPAWGIGELKLLLPRMREVTQQKQWVIWISPPYQPYAPALLQAGVDINYVIVIDPKTSCKDAIWSMEKALQTSACAMILAWTNWLPNGVVRRLQLAAEKGGGMAFLFRERETKNSPAALRLQLQPHQQGVTVQVLKARGSYHYKNVIVPLAG